MYLIHRNPAFFCIESLPLFNDKNSLLCELNIRKTELDVN